MDSTWKIIAIVGGSLAMAIGEYLRQKEKMQKQQTGGERMGFFDNLKEKLGISERQRLERQIRERTAQENEAEADNLDYIQRCITVFNNEKNPSVRVAHLGRAIGLLRALLEAYPHRTDWLGALHRCEAAYNELMTVQLEAELESLLTRADIAKTRASKISAANKGLLLIQSATESAETSYPESVLAEWRDKFTAHIHQTELDTLLMKADKAEFKGEWKKAVSAYQDVLFFLKRDHIPDEEQADQMAEIQAKIEEMQKYLEESKAKKTKEEA